MQQSFSGAHSISRAEVLATTVRNSLSILFSNWGLPTPQQVPPCSIGSDQDPTLPLRGSAPVRWPLAPITAAFNMAQPNCLQCARKGWLYHSGRDLTGHMEGMPRTYGSGNQTRLCYWVGATWLLHKTISPRSRNATNLPNTEKWAQKIQQNRQRNMFHMSIQN